MFGIPGRPVRLCEGWTRREWIRVGGLSTLGLALPEFMRGRAQACGRPPARDSFGRAKSCILAFLFGAPAHQDIWDLKPDAPADVRGEFKPIASSVPGIHVGEYIPLIAARAHRYCLIRSVTHPDNTHTVAMHYMLTGHRHEQPSTNPQNQPGDFPTFGAVMQYLRPSAGPLPSGVSLNAPANQLSANNHVFPGFFAGLLGTAYDPLFVSADPSRPEFQPFPLLQDQAAVRLEQSRSLLSALEQRWDRRPAVRTFSEHYDKAFRLVVSAAARRAFDLAGESDRLRERYGQSAFGQGLLLARRLVEAGVGLVTVNWARDDAFWDTHADNFRQLRDKLLPPFDQALSALLDDLAARRLLDETLVVCLGEFGRTPKINARAGRDHWAACNSVLLAGAGIGGGQVFGASDRTAAYPAQSPVTPDDLSATIYHALGIGIDTELHDAQGRPLPLTRGRPLIELFT